VLGRNLDKTSTKHCGNQCSHDGRSDAEVYVLRCRGAVKDATLLAEGDVLRDRVVPALARGDVEVKQV
jgi:hypothetical protein